MTLRNFNPATRKVDFLIAGTQKGGTSALDAYLREHRRIGMAAEKELHFFDNEHLFSEQRSNRETAGIYSRYHDAFRHYPADRLRGESTPSYMYWPDAPRRIWQYNPAMKFVFLLRNPILRAFSHWNMQRNRGVESLPFGHAIERELATNGRMAPHPERARAYVGRGFYSQQLQRFRKYFPDSQIRIFRQDHLRDAPEYVLNRVCAFLGVPEFESVSPRIVHSFPYVAAMTFDEWLHLHNIYEREIRILESSLGWDCSDWLERPVFSDRAA